MSALKASTNGNVLVTYKDYKMDGGLKKKILGRYIASVSA